MLIGHVIIDLVTLALQLLSKINDKINTKTIINTRIAVEMRFGVGQECYWKSLDQS